MKTAKALLGIAIILMSVLLRTQAQITLTNGLQAYYQFNGNVLDSSGNGNNGTNIGATFTTNRFGQTNSAIYFSNNLVTTGFFPPLGATNRTITGWFDVLDSAAQTTLLVYGSPNTDEAGVRFEIKLFQSGEFALDGSFGTLWTPTSFTDGNWHSFIIVVPRGLLCHKS